jgi:hypothetical protein
MSWRSTAARGEDAVTSRADTMTSDNGSPEQRSSSARARRQREYRARRRQGVRVVSVEVRADVRETLVAEGWLAPEDTADPQMVADAISDLADCWARGTLAPVKARDHDL